MHGQGVGPQVEGVTLHRTTHVAGEVAARYLLHLLHLLHLHGHIDTTHSGEGDQGGCARRAAGLYQEVELGGMWLCLVRSSSRVRRTSYVGQKRRRGCEERPGGCLLGLKYVYQSQNLLFRLSVGPELIVDNNRVKGLNKFSLPEVAKQAVPDFIYVAVSSFLVIKQLFFFL